MDLGSIVGSDYYHMPPVIVSVRSAAKKITSLLFILVGTIPGITPGFDTFSSIEGKHDETIITMQVRPRGASPGRCAGGGSSEVRPTQGRTFVRVCATRARRDGACNAVLARSSYTSVFQCKVTIHGSNRSAIRFFPACIFLRIGSVPISKKQILRFS